MPSSRSRYNWVSILLASLAALLVCGLVIRVFGAVSGREFSPQKFLIRDFRYYCIPFTNLQIWPISFTPATGPEDQLAQFVRTSRHHEQIRAQPTRWDIVMLNRPTSLFVGDAKILVNYLTQPSAAGTQGWLNWSERNPKKSAVLWQNVCRLAHAELYALIPPIMELARSELDPDQYANQVTTVLTSELDTYAAAESAVGNTQRATQLRSLAVTHWGQRSDIQATASDQ